MAAHTILIVSNPEMRGEIYRMLSEAGYKRMLTGDGSEETLELFSELEPDLVVMCAGLDAGDARALSAAMRGTPHGAGVKQILIGERDGPIRTALDAMDFAIDHFLVQPLSANALVYAIRMCLDGAGAEEPSPGASLRLELAMDEAISEFVQTAMNELAPRTAPAAPTGPLPSARGEEAASEAEAKAPEAVAKATEADAKATEADAKAPEAVAKATEAAVSAVPVPVLADPDMPDRVIIEPPRLPRGSTPGAGDARGKRRKPTTGGGDARGEVHRPTLLGAGDVRRAPRKPRAPGASESRETAHKPTLLGVGQPRGAPRKPPKRDTADAAPHAAPATGSSPVAIPQSARRALARIQLKKAPAPRAARSESAPASQPSGSAASTPAASKPSVTAVSKPSVNAASKSGEPAASQSAEPAASQSAEPAATKRHPSATAGDRAREPGSDGDAPSAPSGGDLARDLRRKMSAMADRLFPDRRTEVAAALAVEHDHATEIDLLSLDMASPDAASVDGADTAVSPSRDERTGPIAGDRAAAERAYHAAVAASGDAGEFDREPSSGANEPGDLGVADAGPIRRGETGAAAMLARAFTASFTGRIAFRGAGEDESGDDKSIVFESGRPVFASSENPRDRMGELLYREGKITRAQYHACQDEVERTGRRIGEILVEKGFLKRRELLPAVRRHVEDIIYSLFGWDRGEYAVSAGEFAAGEHIRLSRHPAAMILEGVRRKFGADELVALVGPPETVIEIADDQRRKLVVSVAELSPGERKAVACFDGARELAQVADECALELENVYQLAHGLIAIGAARARRPDADGELDRQGAVLVGESDLAIDRQRVMAKHAQVEEADYFALLGVRRDATSFEIKRAYQAARRDYAREGFPAEVRRELDDEIAAIGEVLDEAYHILRDEEMRAAYLANLRG